MLGDWDNTGSLRIGIFRGGQWFLDTKGTFTFPSTPSFIYGQPGDVPVVGDWDHTGRQRVGVFRNGAWYLDIDGDHQWTSGVDVGFTFGQAGDVPIMET